MNDNILDTLEFHFKAAFNALGLEVTESNKDTPRRIAKMYAKELFKNREKRSVEDLDKQMTLFDNPAHNSKVQSPVIMDDIEFTSTCEHHWMPFMGVCKVTYLPGEKIVGLSKIPRVVKFFSQKPQLQERLTQEICEYLFSQLNPIMVRVEMTATHCCVMCRGAESKCTTSTAYELWNDSMSR